ncbi:hypothetical protein HDU76_004413 [Blyttiomyces sp. JEL0837]|nr:hypothetical protein HDU76_004413 [Blyttiomyces sp. JEL0837]
MEQVNQKYVYAGDDPNPYPAYPAQNQQQYYHDQQGGYNPNINNNIHDQLPEYVATTVPGHPLENQNYMVVVQPSMCPAGGLHNFQDDFTLCGVFMAVFL